MKDVSTIITESIKMNVLLRDIYRHVDDKNIDGSFDAFIGDLQKRIDEIDKCYKSNVLDIDIKLDEYIKDYLSFLNHYCQIAQMYRQKYIIYRIEKEIEMPDKYEELYSEMFSEYKKTDVDGVFSENKIVDTLKKSMVIGREHITASDVIVKYSIFVSSTYEDLKEERIALMTVLLEKNFIPVGMEQFHAIPVSQWDVIKKMIDDCDYYLLIIGGRYGSIDADTGISYTEKEYNYAKKNKIPVIAFLPKNPDNIAKGKMDKDDFANKQKKLEAFKNKVVEEKMVDYYEDSNDLKYAVSASLSRLVEFAPRDGWVRRSSIEKYENSNLNLYEQLEKAKEELNKLKLEMQKKSSIYFGDEEPRDIKENDIWISTNN